MDRNKNVILTEASQASTFANCVQYAMPTGIDGSVHDPGDFTYTVFTGAPRAVFGTVENDAFFAALPS